MYTDNSGCIVLLLRTDLGNVLQIIVLTARAPSLRPLPKANLFASMLPVANKHVRRASSEIHEFTSHGCELFLAKQLRLLDAGDTKVQQSKQLVVVF